MATGRAPAFAGDLYADDAIADPYPHYRAIRDLGPAVRLTAHDAWAIGRFQDVRDALRADTVLVSGRGVAVNDLVNGQASRVTLTSDGDLHRQLRGVLMKPMMPSALRAVEGQIVALADDLVVRLLARGSFDGVADFARHLPVEVVARLVGLPEEGQARMLAWASATFDTLGPMNDRARAAIPTVLDMVGYAAGVERTRLRPGSWAAQLFAAADEGRVEPGDVAGMLMDYIVPSLDTTILGTAHLLYLLGSHPEQWERVRSDPELIPAAVDEALRFEAPVRAFTRLAVADYAVAGTVVPAGSRVVMLFASANRDERRYVDPDRFDVGRDARDHLGFGHGVHRCAGGYLAQLEMQALLRALVARVRTITVGEPVIAVNNVLRGYRSFAAALS